MTDLRALVVYESMFGNTEAVARAVANGLELESFTVRVREVGEAPLGTQADVDLLVVGGPTHAFSLSRPSTRASAVSQGAPASHGDLGLREWLAALPRTEGTGFAAFDTRATKVRRIPKAAAPRAARIARKKGLVLLTKPLGFLVDDIKGPLGPHELERAVQWGRSLAGAARAHAAPEEARRNVKRS
jgi:hypothetical protein